MSNNYDLCYKSTNELEAAGAAYTGYNMLLLKSDKVPVVDSFANFLTKSGLSAEVTDAAETAAETKAEEVIAADNYIVRNVSSVCTLSEINAGKTLIAGVAGKIIKVLGFSARVAGNFTTTTSVDLQDTNSTPVKVQVMAVAALTDGAVLKDGTTNVTQGAGMFANLTSGKGLAVANVGDAAAGGTSITVNVQYVLVDAA